MIQVLMRVRPMVVGFATMAALAIGPPGADAQIRFAGGTTGCFGLGCTPGATDVLGGLTYYMSTFDKFTYQGFAGFGGNPQPNITNFNNFGSMSLANSQFIYNGSLFNLLITFSDPTGTSGQLYQASLIGAVSRTGAGGVNINFDNSPRWVDSDIGRFKLVVNDAAIDPGQLTDLEGYVQIAPEPASMALLGTGLMGLFGAARRRRRQDLGSAV